MTTREEKAKRKEKVPENPIEEDLANYEVRVKEIAAEPDIGRRHRLGVEFNGKLIRLSERIDELPDGDEKKYAKQRLIIVVNALVEALFPGSRDK